MIKFDPAKLSFEIVRMKAVSTVLGGSLSIIDEPRTEATGKEVTTRLAIPFAVAREFIQRTKKVTKYLKPVYTCVVRYEGHVIALDRHPLAGMGQLVEEGVFGEKTWEPSVVRNYNDTVAPMLAAGDRQWYFDGRYAYTFENEDLDASIRDGEFLSQSGAFRKVIAKTIDLMRIYGANDISAEERSCLAFVTKGGQYAVSPPIWKDLSNVGTSQLRGVEDATDDDEDITGVTIISRHPTTSAVYAFDQIDQHLAVNLNFALKAGQEIGKTFGYEEVEPLQLARLMIELHTVNLLGLPKQIKATYDVGMKFTHALAWLLGMSRRANDMDTALMMRALLSYLTKRGIFRANTFDTGNIFKDGKTINDVELVDLSAVRDATHDVSLFEILSKGRLSSKAMRSDLALQDFS